MASHRAEETILRRGAGRHGDLGPDEPGGPPHVGHLRHEQGDARLHDFRHPVENVGVLVQDPLLHRQELGVESVEVGESRRAVA